MITFAEVVEKVEEMDKQLQSTTAAVAGDSYGPSRYEMIEAMRIMERRLRDLEEEVQRHEDGLVALFMQTDDIPAAAAPVPAPPRVDDPHSTKISTWIKTALDDPHGNAEFEAYINDLIVTDMKRHAPGATPVASAHNTFTSSESPAADDPDAPVRCPNCGAPMKWDGRSYICSSSIGDCSILKIDFVTDTTKAKAAAAIQRIVRRMAYHPEKAGAK